MYRNHLHSFSEYLNLFWGLTDGEVRLRMFGYLPVPIRSDDGWGSGRRNPLTHLPHSRQYSSSCSILQKILSLSSSTDFQHCFTIPDLVTVCTTDTHPTHSIHFVWSSCSSLHWLCLREKKVCRHMEGSFKINWLVSLPDRSMTTTRRTNNSEGMFGLRHYDH